MNAPLAFIALGSNLGDSVRMVREAMDRLEQLSTHPLLRSSLWDTSPVDCPAGSGRFVNAVVGLTPQAGETPRSLLERLQALEVEFGRQSRKCPNEPRPLDLDLIIFGTEISSQPDLVIPHPRTHLRRFVLAPLNEIAPGLVIPGQERSVRELLDRLRSNEAVRKIS